MNDADVQQGITVDLVQQYGLTVDRIFGLYREMGGMNTPAEVRGYLSGSSGLLQLQRDLIAHAVNDLLNTPYPRAGTRRAPYSSADIGRVSGYPSSEFDGERLLEHSRWRSSSTDPLSEDAEAERLASLGASGLLDGPSTSTVERLPQLAREHFDVQGAALTLVTADELVTKSAAGVSGGTQPREITFCHETIRFDRTLVVPDTHRDPRFSDSPLVTGPPYIRFYAGHPIQGPGNMRLGALCLTDDRPRTFSAADERKLRTLAALVQLEIWTHVPVVAPGR